jgi:ABC-type antimicrobial peptide transport system permease subunit
VSARFSQSLVTPALSEMVTGEAVSGNYFTALGLSPFQGRLVQLSDDAAPALVAVISHQFWQSRLGADPAALGSTLRIGGKPFEVIGIAPPGFTGLVDRIQSYTAVWVPLGATTMFPSTAAPPDDPQERRRLQLSVFVPAPDPAHSKSLSQEVAAVGARLDTAYPIELQYTPDSARQKVARGWSIRSAAEINDEGDRTMGRTRTAVMAIVGLVLVVACTNLANLVLARASSRQHELAVRGALGASRVRLILDELAETGLLAALGAIGAFIVARTLIIWFSSASIPISQATVVQIEPQVDFSTAAVAAMSVIASLVVFGLLPAIQVTRTRYARNSPATAGRLVTCAGAPAGG